MILQAGHTRRRLANPRYVVALDSQVSERASIPARVLHFLSKPLVDKSVAALAAYPCFCVAYAAYKSGLMDIPRALFFTQAALFVLTMLIRRNPVRISGDPWFWAVAGIYSYYNLLVAGFLRGGVSIVPAQLVNALAVLGVWISIFARLGLGRNIGLIPAQRRIVTGGIYRYVRHPIYSGYFLCTISWALSCFSLVNVLALAFGCAVCVVKTLMEESFLSADPEYAAYMKRVRWRWFPGLL
jgi:isoprenylcysteine carboxyl methyltransferase (ICMT) family protein YpbQ